MSLKNYVFVLFCLSQLAFSSNVDKTYYVIGDLHGNFKAMQMAFKKTGIINIDSIQMKHFVCFDNNYYSHQSQECMSTLVDLVQVNFNDQKMLETYIYQMGDLFDKGQYDIELLLVSEAILLKVEKLNFRKLNVKFFIGNHEYMRSYFADPTYKTFLLDNYKRKFSKDRALKITSRRRRLKNLFAEKGSGQEVIEYFDAEGVLKIHSTQTADHQQGGYANILNNPENRPTILIQDRIVFAHGGISHHFLQNNISKPEDAYVIFEDINSIMANWFSTHDFDGNEKHFHTTILNNSPSHVAGPLFYRVKDSQQKFSNKEDKTNYSPKFKDKNHQCQMIKSNSNIDEASMFNKLKRKLNADFLIVGHTAKEFDHELDGKIRGKCYYRSLSDKTTGNEFRVPLAFITDTGINGDTIGEELKKRSQVLKINVCENNGSPITKFSILADKEYPPYIGKKFTDLPNSPYQGQEAYFGFAQYPSCP